MKNYDILKNIIDKEDRILASSIIDKYNKYLRTNRSVSTCFLDQRELSFIIPILNKLSFDYNVYKPHEYCEKCIIVFGNVDDVDISAIKISCNYKLEHRDYLGSIFSLGIERHSFGDILLDDKSAYVFVTKNIVEYVLYNLYQIRNYNVELEVCDVSDVVINSEKFESLYLNVSSNRIDVIVSKLTNKSRNDVNNYVKKGKIMLNYNILKKNSVSLKENDVFSISGYGKYIYKEIINVTKKSNLILHIQKYK